MKNSTEKIPFKNRPDHKFVRFQKPSNLKFNTVGENFKISFHNSRGIENIARSIGPSSAINTRREFNNF